MDADEWDARGGIDPARPTAARMYDYYLGGMNNFAADRAAAEEVIARMPDVRLIAQVNRAFLRRTVRLLVERGIRQFLDIGSGIPTVGSVHQAAQQMSADSRVVYVDIDPVAISHARTLLEGNPLATAVLGDLRRPRDLLDQLDQPALRAVLDLRQPTALLLVAVLPFVIGDEAREAVAQLRQALVPGSYLALSHGVVGGYVSDQAQAAMKVYQATTTPFCLRTREQIMAFFAGFELVDPGLVWLSQWHPEPGAPADAFGDHPERSGALGGVGRRA
jgi:SAM-dependent methyltransferase